MFDGVKVRGVGRQKQERSPGVFNKLHRVGRFVEGGIVHDDEMGVRQTRGEFRFQPEIEHCGIARSLKQERLLQPIIDAGGDQGGARPSVPGAHPIHAHSPWGHTRNAAQPTAQSHIHR